MAENKNAKKEETKREKFVRIAEKRTAKAMDAIAMLRGLASKANYEYEEADWIAIFGALEGELTKLQSHVKNPTSVSEGGFSLGKTAE